MLKILGAIASLAAGLMLATPAAAFDTGPHANITEQAMAMAGFNRSAGDVVQVENWLTDYYTSRPLFGSTDQCALEKLHFDGVFTPADVDAYWDTLLRNTTAAAQKAADDDDVIGFYAVLGVSLHVVQDFYTHSNWVETSGHTGSDYDTTTYFQWRHSGRTRASVYTGWYKNCLNIPQGSHTPHGDYTSGMNHDSVVRPNYDRAYVYAVAASHEWLQLLKTAVTTTAARRAFWAKALTYSPGAADARALAADQAASLFVSEWIAIPPADGHWNGDHSGYAVAFASFLAAWTASADSPYVKAFKDEKPYMALSAGLYQPFVGTAPTVTPVDLPGRVIRMRVGSVCANFSVGTESYFGQVTPVQAGLPTYPIRDASQYHRPCFTAPWEYILFVPPGIANVSFRYALKNEYGTGAATLVPIHGSATDLTFTCGVSACTWGDTGAAQQAMGGSIDLKGSGFSGVELKGLTIQLADTSSQP